MLEELTLRNRSTMLASPSVKDTQRAQLLAASLVVEKIGAGPLEMALRLVFEEALFHYLNVDMDRLHAMGMSGITSQSRSGNA